MGRLEGKTAIITGAASGIGRATAILFAKEGANVVAADISEAVRETAEMAPKGKVHAVVGDVASQEIVDSLIATACERFNGLDIMFANAGVGGGLARIFELSGDDWAKVLRINTIGVFLAVQAAARKMAEQGKGSIVCTASVAGIRSGAGGMPYSASKAGVISIVQTGANQLAGTGVRINAICPGLTETGMTKPVFDMARERGSEAKLGQLNPLKRAAGPEEIATVALFLASDDSSYVNGQFLAVDGGLSSSHPTVPGKFV